MKRTFSLWLLLCCFSLALTAAPSVKEKLEALPGISGVETLQSNHFAEKYLLRITQPLDPKHPEAGTFTQRVVVAHVGYDRPTVLVTEGYGGDYALDPRYQEELTKLLNANLVFVEHRYFLESTPTPLNWDYLTAENSAYDLHHVNQTLRQLYPTGKWISTGVSKGGQTTMLYRAYFPDDVDISVPYVAPLNRSAEDERNEQFLRKVGTKAERAKILRFQTEVFTRKADLLPLLEKAVAEKKLRFSISIPELFDYCVLEYSFALWQWGTSVSTIPLPTADTQTLFDHLMAISGPDYFALDQPTGSFFVQAARELGYYTYDTKPFKKWLTITSSQGYLQRIMVPQIAGTIAFSPALYEKVHRYLKENDPKMIFIYGEIDPWSATRPPQFKGKKNQQMYIQPRGSHSSRIGTMPEEMKTQILTQLNRWLAE